MAHPMWLDPKTLRWLAEEADGEEAEASRMVERCHRSSDTQRRLDAIDLRLDFEELARRWERSAAVAKRRAQRLRTMATEIERANSTRRA